MNLLIAWEVCIFTTILYMRKLRLKEVNKCSRFLKQSSWRAGAESRWERPLTPSQLFPLFCAVSMALDNGLSEAYEPQTWSPYMQLHTGPWSHVFLPRLALPRQVVTLLSPILSKLPSFYVISCSNRKYSFLFPCDLFWSYVSEQAIGHVRIKTESKMRSQDTWVPGLQPALWVSPPPAERAAQGSGAVKAPSSWCSELTGQWCWDQSLPFRWPIQLTPYFISTRPGAIL